jgi:hypothetical protein
VQFCPDCGAERESKVHFDGPRYHRTQEPIRDFTAALLEMEPEEAGGFTSIAA